MTPTPGVAAATSSSSVPANRRRSRRASRASSIALEWRGPEAALPYCRESSSAATLDEKARGAAAQKPEPSFTEFRQYAEQYLKSGEEAYARQAMAALDIMVGIYREKPNRPVPWPEETTSGAILATWDAFEECPLITAEQRRDYTNAFLKLARSLVPKCSDYAALGKEDLVSWNHTTFPLLGLYFAGRYFDRYYQLPEARGGWRRRTPASRHRRARGNQGGCRWLLRAHHAPCHRLQPG